jgi:GT2 family glycosyltransferase
MKPTVSVIIPNYNGRTFLKGCIESLEAQTFSDFEIIVVDNGSDDGSVDFIKKNFPRIKTIANRKNLGFAKANNQGYEIASGRYIVTLNNDTTTGKAWLEKLVLAAEENTGTGMFASKIISMNDRGEIDSVGVNICLDGMTRGRARGEKDEGQYDADGEILLPSACAALYRRKMLDETGFFDESFFAYCEDTDLGLRGRLAGWTAMLVPDAVVYHYYSETGGKYSSFKAYLVERNHTWVLIKNFPGELLALFPVLTVCRFLLQVYAAFTKQGATGEFMSGASLPDVLKLIIHAYLDTLKELPDLLKKRRAIKKIKKITRTDFYALLRKHRMTFRELVLNK